MLTVTSLRFASAPEPNNTPAVPETIPLPVSAPSVSDGARSAQDAAHKPSTAATAVANPTPITHWSASCEAHLGASSAFVASRQMTNPAAVNTALTSHRPARPSFRIIPTHGRPTATRFRPSPSCFLHEEPEHSQTPRAC